MAASRASCWLARDSKELQVRGLGGELEQGRRDCVEIWRWRRAEK